MEETKHTAMMSSSMVRIGMLCYSRLTQLDLTGPLEVLARMAGSEVHILWKDTSPVRTECGLYIVPDLKLSDAPPLDLVVVPGGPGQQDLMQDHEVLSFLRTQVSSAQYMVSVCTGSLILGAAGLLQGYRATCHWMFLPLLEQLGAMPTRERVVIDRNKVTAAGVSAGIDCALHLVSLLRGREAAQAIQLQIEYDPQPPFDCGSTNKAPEWLVQKLTETAKATFEARRKVIERIGAVVRCQNACQFSPYGVAMSATLLYRIATFLLVLLALGHTYSFLTLRAPSAEGRAVYDAMNAVHFELGGRSHSYGEIYRGLGLFCTVSLVFSAFLSWHLGELARHAAGAIGTLGWVFFVVQLATVVLSFLYFGLPPMVVSTLVTVIVGLAAWVAGR